MSNFSSLSAGLIERGKVSDEVLYGADAAEPETDAGPAARSNIIGAAAAKVAEARRAALLGEAPVVQADPSDKARPEVLAEALAEERTRTRQTNFGSLSGGMMERGKLPRHILTQAQIELLLMPQQVNLELLLPSSEDAGLPATATVDPGDAAAIFAEPVVDADTADGTVEPEPEPAVDEAEAGSSGAAEPDVAASSDGNMFPPADAPPESALRIAEPRPVWDNTLRIIRAPDADVVSADRAAEASISDARRTALRPIAISLTTLLIATIGGWMLLRTVGPATEPAPAAVAQIAETIAPDPPSPTATAETSVAVDTAPEVASTPVTAPPLAADTAEDGATAPVRVIARQRPGAVPYEPEPTITPSAPPVSPIAPAPEPEPAAIESAPTIASSAAPAMPTALAPASIESTAELVQRGDGYLLNGDIITARLYYERAAEAGDPQAMMALAQTYDPLLLRKAGARGVRPDPEQAQRWYAKAAEISARPEAGTQR